MLAFIIYVPEDSTFNCSIAFLPFKNIKLSGFIPPSMAATSGLKYLCHQKFLVKSHPLGIFLCRPTAVSFLSIALSKAISL